MNQSSQSQGFFDASQYNSNSPGSFQTVNGKMYFFPAILQTPHEFNSSSNASPYPVDWKFQSQAKTVQPTVTSGAQMYHANNFTNTGTTAKPTFAPFKAQNYGDLAVHFFDTRLNEEKTYNFSNNTTKDFDNPAGPFDFKYTVNNPGFEAEAQKQYFNNQYPNANVFATGQPVPHYGSAHVAMPNFPQYPQQAYDTYQQYQQQTMPNQPNNFATKFPSLSQDYIQNKYAPPQFVPYEKEVIHYVPKIEKKFVEQEVFVYGNEKNYVSQPFEADTYVIVPDYKDVEVKFVVSESVVPEIEPSDDVIEVEVNKYEPEIQYVDIYVPRPIALPIKATGAFEQYEKKSSKISQEHMMQSLEGMNPHIKEIENYNAANAAVFNKYVEHANEIAASYNLEAPEPAVYTKDSFNPEFNEQNFESANATQNESEFTQNETETTQNHEQAQASAYENQETKEEATHETENTNNDADNQNHDYADEDNYEEKYEVEEEEQSQTQTQENPSEATTQ